MTNDNNGWAGARRRMMKLGAEHGPRLNDDPKLERIAEYSAPSANINWTWVREGATAAGWTEGPGGIGVPPQR